MSVNDSEGVASTKSHTTTARRIRRMVSTEEIDVMGGVRPLPWQKYIQDRDPR
jgi:hypothetical protein